ncbi:ribosome maturation factor RimM [Accumulibacter sp.]|uniref:ribosome maturation factor RimM n=1 Tax=Accumulibacter sp. TaxID=2053492 RepID=UPI0025E95EBE|nr:ribosome maturation factor RimM [Accumulibacter sp.]MCM8594051.1 ribosome maturation factor RimM [Accumulibacter sp.]MCM8627621.1 ribosome maturation factor RimM [Accumulibacter sp.]MDS4048195.1 ribosome maturation factor RimM [Accumulibacter sp.]
MPARAEEIIVLGRIVSARGLQGEVRVFPYADDPDDWARLSHWWLGREGDTPDRWQPTRLLHCRSRQDLLIARLECAGDRDAAESLGGLLVGAPRGQLPPTGRDEYYWADLIGLEVVNTKAESLGHVAGLIDTPANPVLRVARTDGDEGLLPFVSAVVLEVDLGQGRVTVDWESDW